MKVEKINNNCIFSWNLNNKNTENNIGKELYDITVKSNLYKGKYTSEILCDMLNKSSEKGEFFLRIESNKVLDNEIEELRNDGIHVENKGDFVEFNWN